MDDLLEKHHIECMFKYAGNTIYLKKFLVLF